MAAQNCNELRQADLLRSHKDEQWEREQTSSFLM